MQLSRAAPLVLGVHHVPRRLGRVGVEEHGVLGPRVVGPPLAGLEVHVAQLPPAQRVDRPATWNRRSCSASLTENQYLTRMMPSSINWCSNTGHWRRNRWYCSSVQKPITRSTPARLYQLRSNRASSPDERELGHIPLEVPLARSRSVGAGQGHDPAHPRAQVLVDPLDDAALAGGVATLEDDDHPGAGSLDPLVMVVSSAWRRGAPSRSAASVWTPLDRRTGRAPRSDRRSPTRPTALADATGRPGADGRADRHGHEVPGQGLK